MPTSRARKFVVIVRPGCWPWRGSGTSGDGGSGRHHRLDDSLRSKLHSTNPLERVNKVIKRRINVVGTFPNRDVVIRLIGALMLEQNDEWAVSRRFMPMEKLTAVCNHAEAAPMIAAQ